VVVAEKMREGGDSKEGSSRDLKEGVLGMDSDSS
jgi:hypothetical protein